MSSESDGPGRRRFARTPFLWPASRRPALGPWLRYQPAAGRPGGDRGAFGAEGGVVAGAAGERRRPGQLARVARLRPYFRQAVLVVVGGGRRRNGRGVAWLAVRLRAGGGRARSRSRRPAGRPGRSGPPR